MQQQQQQQNQPVYRYAKGAANRASQFLGANGGFPSTRSLGSMNDLSSAQHHNLQNSHSNSNNNNSSNSGNNIDAAVGTTSSNQNNNNTNNNNGATSLLLTQAHLKSLIEPLVNAMKQTSYYEIMSNSSLVVVLDINAAVSVCVAAAQESRATCFLVWDPYCKETGKGYFVTILTLTNFIRILIHCHENQDQVSQLSNMSLRELLKQDFASGRTLAVDATLSNCSNNNNNNNIPNSRNRSTSSANAAGRVIMHAGPDITLYNLLGLMIDNSINHVPILADSEYNPSQDAAAPTTTATTTTTTTTTSPSKNEQAPTPSAHQQPTGLLGVSFLPQLLSQVVRSINNPTFSANNGTSATSTSTSPSPTSSPNFCPYSSLFEVPLSQLAALSPELNDKLNSKDRRGSNSWLRGDESVYAALQRLIQQGLQALPVIDDRTGAIVDTFSRSDVIGLEDLGIYNLNQACKAALETRSKHRSIAVCHIHDTVGDVVAHFVASGVRTLFVVSSVNSSDEFVGHIQVADLLRFLYKASKE